jgi:hypothetical protein
MKIQFISKKLFASLAITVTAYSALAQSPELQQKLAEVKQAAAENKQALARYSWQEQQTTAIKGGVKDTKTSEVRLGPDGKPQKMETGDMPQSSGGRQRGLAHHAKEKKGEEYKDYGQQIAALAQQYAQPDPERLQQAFQQGNIMMGPAGSPAVVQMVISNYVKPNDKVTLIFNRQAKAIQGLQVQSYLQSPTDAVTIAVQFSQLPDGTNHPDMMQINGVSKQLKVTIQNSNYQKISM